MKINKLLRKKISLFLSEHMEFLKSKLFDEKINLLIHFKAVKIVCVTLKSHQQSTV